MANAVNRDAICNCLFRYLAQYNDCCNKSEVIDKIANIISRYVIVDVMEMHPKLMFYKFRLF